MRAFPNLKWEDVLRNKVEARRNLPRKHEIKGNLYQILLIALSRNQPRNAVLKNYTRTHHQHSESSRLRYLGSPSTRTSPYNCGTFTRRCILFSCVLANKQKKTLLGLYIKWSLQTVQRFDSCINHRVCS